MAIRQGIQAARGFRDMEFFQPDQNLIAQVLGVQQQGLDTFRDQMNNIQIQSLDPDRQRAAEILQGYQQGIDENADLFLNKGLASGQADLRKRLRQLNRDMTTGEIAQINANYAARQKFAKEVQDRLAKGKINQMDAQALLATQDAAFEGTAYDPQSGLFNQYKGTSIADMVNLDDRVDELIKNYKPDTYVKGSGFIGEDGYIYKRRIQGGGVERVDIENDLVGALSRDQGLAAYNQQRVRTGLTTPERIQEEILGAIRRGGSVAGFTDQRNELYIQGASEELKHRNRMIEKKFENDLASYGQTPIFSMGKQMKISGKSLRSKPQHQFAGSGVVNPGSQSGLTQQETAPEVSIKDAMLDPSKAQLYLNSRNVKDPDMALEFAEKLRTKNIIDPTTMSADEIDDRVANYMQTSINTAMSRSYGIKAATAKEQKNVMDQFRLNEEDGVTQLNNVSHKVFAMTPNGIEEFGNIEQAKKELGIKDGSFGYDGKLLENSKHPNALVFSAKGDKGILSGETNVSLIVEGFDQADTKRNAPMTNLLKAGHGEADIPIPVQLDKDVQIVVIPREVISEDGRVTDRYTEYGQMMEDGSIQEVSFEELKKFHNSRTGQQNN